MSSSLPKAVLYEAPQSIWCASVFLTLEEKGYGPDDLDLRVVDLSKGENFAPSFLRLNPKATVPTLVVPFEDTISGDVESRYKALTETKDIIEFLDKSRSAVSHTHSTSSAPAPSLTPATIAFASKSAAIIDALHSKAGDPNKASSLNARDPAALRVLARTRLPLMQGRADALAKHLAEAESETVRASEKTKAFWREKLQAMEWLLAVFACAEKDDAKMTEEERKQRSEFFSKAKEIWEVQLREVLTEVNAEIMAPFTLGDHLSIADLHLAAWLQRLVRQAGGDASEDGRTAIGKLQAHIGNDFVLPNEVPGRRPERIGLSVTGQATSKLAIFWDAMRQRPSWKKVYLPRRPYTL